MAQNEPEKPKRYIPIPKIINVGIGGIVAVLTVFPLDLVKTRLQNQPIGPNGEKMYKNMLHCFVKTFRAEGFLGMYKGVAVNIMLHPIDKAIKLTANDYFRYKFTDANGKIPMPSQLLAGALAGICQNVVITPKELLKIRMQDAGRAAAAAKADGKTVKKVTAIKITLNLLKESGIMGLYRGSGPTLLRDIVFSMIYFPLFAAVDTLGPRRNDGTNEAVFWSTLLAALSSGCFAAFLTNPIDLMKTRLQADSKSYKGVIDCMSKTWQREGFLAFFKGAFCRASVIGPIHAIPQAFFYFGIAEALLGLKKYGHS